MKKYYKLILDGHGGWGPEHNPGINENFLELQEAYGKEWPHTFRTLVMRSQLILVSRFKWHEHILLG